MVKNRMKYKVDLNNLEKVNNFVNCMQSIPYETYLCSGRYVVDAKSIVGIFSLDLSKPIFAEFYGNIPNDIKDDIKKVMLR